MISNVIDRICHGFFPTLTTENVPMGTVENWPCCIIVVDVSPSMENDDWKPSRLSAAKDSAKAYISRLTSQVSNAYIAIVSYGRSAKIECGLTPISDQATLRWAVDEMTTRSCTNITSGLQSALDLLAIHANTHRQIILLTDGEHNHGKGPLGVASRLRQFATIEVVGIGGSPSEVDEDLLMAIASKYPDGTPRYRWIGDKERLVQHFETLAGRLSRT